MGNMAQGQSIYGPLKISQIISYLYTFRKKKKKNTLISLWLVVYLSGSTDC